MKINKPDIWEVKARGRYDSIPTTSSGEFILNIRESLIKLIANQLRHENKQTSSKKTKS